MKITKNVIKLDCTKGSYAYAVTSIMNWNKEKLIDSLQKLSVKGVKYLCPAHGEPMELNNNWSNFIKKYAKMEGF